MYVARKLFSLSCILAFSFAASAYASSIEFQSGTFSGEGPGACQSNCPGSDGVNSSSGAATFSITGTGQLQVVLNNTSANVWDNAQNINGFSFLLTGTGPITQSSVVSYSVTSGNSITGMTKDGTLGYSPVLSGSSATLTSDWKNDSDANLHFGGNYISLNAAGGGAVAGTIAGAPDASGIYETPSGTNGETCKGAQGNIGTSCGSDLAYGNLPAAEYPMADTTATFLFTITGINSSTVLATNTGSGCTGSSTTVCISSVQFGFGGSDPDDSDDVTAGAYVPNPPPVVPEPTSLLLLGTGLLTVGGILHRKLHA